MWAYNPYTLKRSWASFLQGGMLSKYWRDKSNTTTQDHVHNLKLNMRNAWAQTPKDVQLLGRHWSRGSNVNGQRLPLDKLSTRREVLMSFSRYNWGLCQLPMKIWIYCSSRLLARRIRIYNLSVRIRPGNNSWEGCLNRRSGVTYSSYHLAISS